MPLQSLETIRAAVRAAAVPPPVVRVRAWMIALLLLALGAVSLEGQGPIVTNRIRLTTTGAWITSISGDPTTGAGVGGAAGSLALRNNGTVYKKNSATATDWSALAVGGGDVTAASAFANDNRLIRSDGTGKGVQASGITISDADAATGLDYDFEGTENDVTVTTLLEYQAGIAQNGAASAGCSYGATNFPAATPVSGSNVVFASLAFDAATDESIHCRFWLPADAARGGTFTGTVDVEIMWRAGANANEVCWCVATGAAGNSDPSDPTLDDKTCVNDTADGTANDYNIAVITGIDVDDWATGKVAFLRFFRNADAGDESAITEDDDMTGDAELISFRVIVRTIK